MKSQEDQNPVSKGFLIEVYVQEVVEEFRRIFKALKEKLPEKDINQLLYSDSTEKALKEHRHKAMVLI